MRTIKKGGLRKKDPNKSNWEAVYAMINNPKSHIYCISYDSLKGIVFKLEIRDPDDDDIEFYGLNEKGTAFTDPVTCLIFKFVIIGHYGNIRLPDDLVLYNNGQKEIIYKKTEDLYNFHKEATNQQAIYVSSIAPNGHAICPAIVDFKQISGKDNINNLIKSLYIKHRGNQLSEPIGTQKDKVWYMLRYLNDQAEKNGYSLGLISMELVDNSYVGLYSLYKADSPNRAYNSGCIYAIAQLLRLFIKPKIINYDCHLGNVLTKIDGSESVMIDFGRIINLNDETPFGGSESTVKTEYNKFGNYDADLAAIIRLSETDLFSGGRRTDDPIINNMASIIKFISILDYTCNNVLNNSQRTRPQMIDLLTYIYGRNFSRDWKTRRPVWTVTEDVKTRYDYVIPVFTSLCEVPQDRSMRNGLSQTSINNMIQRKDIYSVPPLPSSGPAAVPAYPEDLSDSSSEEEDTLLSSGLRQRRPAAAPAAVAENADEDCDPVRQTCCDRVTGFCRRLVGLKGGKTQKRVKNKNKNKNKKNTNKKNKKRTNKKRTNKK